MRTIYEDIYWNDGREVIAFGNARLQLQLTKADGGWRSLRFNGLDGSVVDSPEPGLGVDAKVDGEWVVSSLGARLARYEIGLDRLRRRAYLVVLVTVGDRYELTVRYALYPGRARLDRSARLVWLGDQQDDIGRRFEGFRFELPGFSAGEPRDCVVDVPGPWFPQTYVAPDTPYSKLAGRAVGFHTAPDGGFGIVAVDNLKRGRTVAAWVETEGETHYAPAIDGARPRFNLSFEDYRAVRLVSHSAVESDIQRTEMAEGGVEDAYAPYRAMCEQFMPLDPRTPEWVSDMRLLEVYPAYYKGGLKELTERLPGYREIGFNTLYLMPHWLGGYSPVDPYQVDPAIGTPDELKRMVGKAHDLGMRVLFDMVIHGFNEKSPLLRQHSEFFMRDEQGNITRHPTWKSMATDWASPAYQQYMEELVLHDLRAYGNDGYRVDAASFKGPNWDPHIPYPAYRSATASPELMERLMAAMRRVNPEAVLLSEVFGPVFYTPCNLVHDNQTEACQQLLELMDAGEATAVDYRKHLARVQALLPAGARRVLFARNHDTSWFYHFDGYTPRFMALDAVHALCGIPEVFAGDPKNGPSPDDDPAIYDYYRKLFALRGDFPELAGGELIFNRTECGNAWVFTALRRKGEHLTLVVINLSRKEETATVWVRGLPPTVASAVLLDPIGGEKRAVELAGNDPKTLHLTLRPFEVLVGRLDGR